VAQATKLELGVTKNFFEEMGPLVINPDGTSGYLSNWKEMSPYERNTTIRLLMRRNRIRIANLTGNQDHLSVDEKKTLERNQDEQRRLKDPDDPLSDANLS